MSKKVLFIWGSIFILASGIIYTVQEVLDGYIWTKQIGLEIERYDTTAHDFTVITPFAVIGAILWLISIIKKEK